MVRLKLWRECSVSVEGGVFVDHPAGNDLSLYIDDGNICGWLDYVYSIDELDYISEHPEELSRLMSESLSEREFDIVMNTLDYYKCYTDHRGRLIKF